jgi:hypothetical protein
VLQWSDSANHHTISWDNKLISANTTINVVVEEDSEMSGEHKGHNHPNEHSGQLSHMHHSGHGMTAIMNKPPVHAIWKFSQPTPQSGIDELIKIQIQDHHGNLIESFEVDHEKQMHLIVVSKDLSYFNHIHPEYLGSGLFQVTTNFPSGGKYELIADFILGGSNAQTVSHWITVSGDVPLAQPLVPDEKLIKVVDGKEITLTFDKLQSEHEVTLNFVIQDAVTKQPISNLEPYLGATGHVVALSADAETYLHIHPVDEKSKGPQATFMTKFPAGGVYKLWGQFQHQGRLFTVPFTIQVP